MPIFGGRKYKLRCPKCKGKELWLSEVWAGNGIWFHLQNGVLPEKAEDQFQGGPVHVDAKCMKTDCQHTWKVRGARSVEDLVVEAA